MSAEQAASAVPTEGEKFDAYREKGPDWYVAVATKAVLEFGYDPAVYTLVNSEAVPDGRRVHFIIPQHSPVQPTAWRHPRGHIETSHGCNVLVREDGTTDISWTRLIWP